MAPASVPVSAREQNWDNPKQVSVSRHFWAHSDLSDSILKMPSSSVLAISTPSSSTKCSYFVQFPSNASNEQKNKNNVRSMLYWLNQLWAWPVISSYLCKYLVICNGKHSYSINYSLIRETNDQFWFSSLVDYTVTNASDSQNLPEALRLWAINLLIKNSERIAGPENKTVMINWSRQDHRRKCFVIDSIRLSDLFYRFVYDSLNAKYLTLI